MTEDPSHKKDQSDKDQDNEDDIPYLQKLFERPFLLLIAGLLVMIIFYTLWGIVEIMRLPQAPLP